MDKIQKNKLVYKTSAELPVLNNYKVTWDLANLYYKNEKDPRIEQDILHIISTYQNFAKKWRKKEFTTNIDLLVASLKDYEKLCADGAITRPSRYFSLRSELDANDSVADKTLALIRKRVRPAADNLLFYTLQIGKISVAEQKRILADEKIKPYKYFLKNIFLGAKHDLSEAEEKIINLKAPQSSSLWQQMTDRQISSSEITWKGKKIPLPESLEMIETLKSEDKPKLWEVIIDKIDSFGIAAEYEFNAIITDVRTEDDLRKYQKPYSATALSYQHDEQSIEALVKAVSTKGFALSKKFYQLKAKYHGVEKIHYAQKYDSIGIPPTINFDEALLVCRDVFYQVNPKYGVIFDEMLKNGQLDVYPKKGKRGGAFMSSQTGHPIAVMLNHTDTMKALETLAHEMGHAVHAARSATQPALYDGHSIVTAETASTLFENLVFDAIFAGADKDTKLVLLHDKISGDIATMQRQIAFFNCELEIHNTIHSQGAMTHEELKKCMHKHLTSYLGPSVLITPKDGASYVYIPHLRYGFYVYTYTFGNLMSTTMASHYKHDNSYREKIDTFLSAGQSDSVANIFKKIGIDTTKPDTFTEALKAHEKDISNFSKLIK
jgi:oligoendopeptidase F